MSYYYGIAFTWGYYYGLAATADKKSDISNNMINIKGIPSKSTVPSDESPGWHGGSSSSEYTLLNKPSSGKWNTTDPKTGDALTYYRYDEEAGIYRSVSSSGLNNYDQLYLKGFYRFDYFVTESDVYNIPSTLHVNRITQEMTRISYINCTFNSSKIMTSSDKYSATAVVQKIHHVNGKYFQFKFSGDSVALPTQADLTGSMTLSKWRNIMTGLDYNPGASVTCGEDEMIFSAIYA